ncbi:MAG: oligosaccharide flippase family protein [Bacteroidales bacterium]|nr:oligosaccharide flippase family protein [Bacteroidales bacterium]
MQKQFKNLLKGILIYGFGNVSIKLVGLVLLKLYTNPKYLSVEEYGVFSMLEVSMMVVVSLFSLALNNAYIRWYWDKDYINQRKSILFSCLAVLLGTGIILSFSGYFSSKTISIVLFGKDTFALPITLMVIGASIQFLIDLVLAQMRVEEKPTFYISSNILRLTVSLIATIYLLKYAHRGVVGIQEALLLGNFAFVFITIPYLLKHIEAKFNLAVIKDMLHFSLPLAIGSISGVLLNVFDRYVLNFSSTLLNVGLYTLAFKIANTTKIFIISSIQIALTPTYFKLMNHPDHKSIYSRIMTWFTIVVVYASLFISLFGLEITKLFSTGTIYWDAYKIIPILSLGIIFATLKDTSVIGLQVVKKTKIIGITLSGIAVLSLGLNLLLVPFLGPIGGAISSFLAQFIYFTIIHYYAQKHYHIPYRLDRIFIVILVGIILYIAGSLFNNYSLEIRILSKSISLFLFPFLLFFFRVFDKSEVDVLKSFITSIRNIFINAAPKEIDEQISEVEEPQ